MKKKENINSTVKYFEKIVNNRKWSVVVDDAISLKWYAYRNYNNGIIWVYSYNDGFIKRTVINDNWNGVGVSRECSCSRIIKSKEEWENLLKEIKSFENGVELIRKLDPYNPVDLGM